MNCQSCGSQMRKEARTCPNCGTLTDAEAHSPVIVNTPQSVDSSYGSNPYSTAGVPHLATSYGSDPYGPASSNPYSEQSNPYGTFVPPPPPVVRRKKRLTIIVGVSLLVLVLAGTATFVWLGWLLPHPLAFSQLTPAEAQALYNRTTREAPSLDDVLASPDNYGWDNYSRAHTSCAFSGYTYHAAAKPGYFSPCYAKATNYSNYIFQAQVTVVSGHSAGIVFRADSTNDEGYQFRISTDGTSILNKSYLGSQGQYEQDTLFSGHGLSIAGTNQPNLVSVMVRGSYISLFVNGKYMDSVSDSTYQSGQIGVYTDSDASAVDAAFHNVRVWKLQETP